MTAAIAARSLDPRRGRPPSPHGGRPARDVHEALVFAVLGCGLVLAAAFVALLLSPSPAPPPLGYDGTPLTGLFDVTPLRCFHEALLLATACVGAAGLLWPRASSLIGSRAAPGVAAGLAGLFVATVVGAVWLDGGQVGSAVHVALFAERYGLTAMLSPLVLGGAGLVSCVVAVRLRRLARIPDHWTLWGALLLYTMLATLPGLVLPFDLARTPPGTLQMVEWHYDEIIGAKNDLVRGVEPRSFGYGVGLSLFGALVERAFGPFSFAGDIRFVQLGNVAFSLFATAALCLLFRGRAAAALVAALLVLPWSQSLHQAIFFPNQAGWRFVFIPIALGAFALGSRGAATRVAPAFGLIAGTAVGWNPETGIPVLLGLASHLVGRLPDLRPRSLALAGALFAAGVVAAFAAITAAYAGLLGHPLPVATLVAAFVMRMQGYPFGIPFRLDALGLVILASGIGAVLAGAWTRRSAPLAPGTAAALGSGVIIAVWAPYYLQRSHWWNLWGFLLPFSVIVGVAWSKASEWPTSRRALAAVWAALAFCVAFVVGPAIVGSNLQMATSLYRAASVGDPGRDATTLSGVLVSAPAHAAVNERMVLLGSAPAGTLVFTSNTYLLPKLLGRRDLFVLPDPAFGHLHDGGATEAEFRAVFDLVRARAPATILLEDDATPAGDDFHRRYFAALREGLRERYHPDGERSGWSIWRKR